MGNQQIVDIVKFVGAILASVVGTFVSIRSAIARGATKKIDARLEYERKWTAIQDTFNAKQTLLTDDALEFAHRADERSKSTEETLSRERAEWDRARKAYTDQINELTTEVKRLNRLVESFREQLAKLTEDV